MWLWYQLELGETHTQSGEMFLKAIKRSVEKEVPLIPRALSLKVEDIGKAG